MTQQVDSHWGRPLNRYVVSYTRQEAGPRLPELDDPEQQLAGKEAIERICAFELDATSPTNRVTLADLYTVFTLSRSPISYSLFESPRLIRSCIHLMSIIPPSEAGRLSPLNHEYGYLCFRILAISLGTCLVNRKEGLRRMLLKHMPTDCEPILFFSRCVTVVVLELVTHSLGDDRGSYNCILGWSYCHECPRESEIVSPSDASTLLKLLWDDDKQFMKAMLWTYSPGLSSVMYLLWRYAVYERYLQTHPSPRRFIVPFVDVYWRCILSAPPDQSLAFSAIRAFSLKDSLIWRESPVRSELTDSRLLIEIGIDKLHQGTLAQLSMDGPLPIDDIPDVLFFLRRHFVPGCEDLIPLLIGTTVRRYWTANVGDKIDRGVLLVSMADAFSLLRGFFRLFKEPTRTNKHTNGQIFDQILDNDLVGLIGCIMLILNPTPPFSSSSGESERNKNFLKGCVNLFTKLARLPPENKLDAYFDARGVGWWKFYWHLQNLEEYVVRSTGNVGFYNYCSNVWAAMRPSTGHLEDRPILTCMYERCPAPRILWGLELICQRCLKQRYCSFACQERDWALGIERRPSRGGGMCRHSLPLSSFYT